MVREGKIDGVSELRDETNRQGIRVVVELRPDAPEEVILNQLYKMTSLQTTFGVNMLALVNGRPQTLTLKQMLRHFIDFRREVVVRRVDDSTLLFEESVRWKNEAGQDLLLRNVYRWTRAPGGAFIRLEHLLEYLLEKPDRSDAVAKIQAYREQYGV